MVVSAKKKMAIDSTISMKVVVSMVGVSWIMGDMDIWEAISAICAVLTAIGAVIAWWRSNLSRDAQRQAVKAEGRAEKQAKAAHAQAYEARRKANAAKELVETLKAQVAAAEAAATEAKRQADISESQATDVKKIADYMQGPDFTLKEVSGNRYELKNNSREPLTIVSIKNAKSFIRQDTIPPANLLLHPYESWKLSFKGSAASSFPSHLFLEVKERDRRIAVSIFSA